MVYEPPDWAAPPSKHGHSWTLQEIKHGVILHEYDLSGRAVTCLGRSEDQVDIALQHESCSRQHARIAFDAATGTPWFMDLQSTHGTTVNKRPLPKQACRKTETNTTTETTTRSSMTGSRGVILYPNDVLQFGASTRVYCLQGPAEFERGAAKPRIIPVRKSNETMSKQEEDSNEEIQKGDSDTAWRGLDRLMDPLQEQGDGGDSSSSLSTWLDALDESQIPRCHRKDLEHVRALKYKLDQVEQEQGRIVRKGTLTAGQESQLERLRQRQEQLQSTLAEKQQLLYNALKQHPGGQQRSDHQDCEDADDDDDDEVEDRTQQQQQHKRKENFNEEADTEDSLTKKRLALLEEQERCVLEESRLQTKLMELQQQCQKLDDEEAFFCQNKIGMVQEQLSKQKTQIRNSRAQLMEVESLLKIVAPNRSSTADPPPEFVVPAPVLKRPRETMDDDFARPMALPPPPPSSSIHPHKDSHVSPSPSSGLSSMGPPLNEPPPQKQQHKPPPQKQKRVMGPSMPPPPPPQRGTLAALQAAFLQNDDSSNNTKNKTILPESTPIYQRHLAAMPTTASADRSMAPPPKSPVNDPNNNNNTMMTKTTNSETEDLWRPPKDQDGSGYTKLNAKFGGRY